MGLIYAVVTVLAWGTWLLPSQRIRFSSPHVRTLYISAANLALTTAVMAMRGFAGLTVQVAWLPFLGGLVWALSGYCAFAATERLGMARASGIWSPLNIVVGMIWGAVLFGELRGLGVQGLAWLLICLALIIVGILLIVLARGGGQRANAGATAGFLGALAAGVLWGTYFIPIQLSHATLWAASLPLAAGMFVGSAALVALSGQSPRLDRTLDYVGVLLSGALWGIGNDSMLLMTGVLGTGRGFTIAQLGLVVNALVGVFVLRDPRPRSRAALLTLVGVALALAGGIGLGGGR